MGWLDVKWIVEYEYSNGIFSSNKKGTMVVEASGEYDAKSKAKSVLKGSYSYVKILSAHKSGGKSEENKATFKPKQTVVEKPQARTYENSAPARRELTPEEKEKLREKWRQEEEIRRQKRKLEEIELKAKAVKKVSKYHIKKTVLAGILSLVVFLLSWIPYLVLYFPAIAGKSQLSMWIELGHSETDEYSLELKEGIAKATKEANGALWIPFVVLTLCIIVTVIVFVFSKRKTKSKVEKATEELNVIVRKYEEEYGEIGTIHERHQENQHLF